MPESGIENPPYFTCYGFSISYGLKQNFIVCAQASELFLT